MDCVLPAYVTCLALGSFSLLLRRCTAVRVRPVCLAASAGGNSRSKRSSSFVQTFAPFGGIVPRCLWVRLNFLRVVSSSRFPRFALSFAFRGHRMDSHADPEARYADP